MSKRILITGGSGQLGQTLSTFLSPKWEVRSLGRAELDLSDEQSVHDQIQQWRPQWVLNCAAYTKVDLAETEKEAAYQINDRGLGFLADAVQATGGQIVHYSTDYVFDGESTEPYLESDAAAPLNVYGASKLAGEDRLLQHEASVAVLRTSWLYSERQGNFFSTMHRLGLQFLSENKSLTIVDDQRGTPTDVWSLAQQTSWVIENNLHGLFHASCTGDATWFEFAKAIFKRLGIEVEVLPITSDQYPQQAKRPKYSVLENHEFKRQSCPPMRHWEEGLDDVVERFLQREKA